MKKTAFFKVKQPYITQFSRIFTVRPIFWIISGLISGILASFVLWKHPFTGDEIPHQSILDVASNSQISIAQRSYEEWKQIIEKRPDYRDGYVMLAWYARELGKPDEAHAHIQKAVALDPNYSIPEAFRVEK
jgi:hypothetical protein